MPVLGEEAFSCGLYQLGTPCGPVTRTVKLEDDVTMASRISVSRVKNKSRGKVQLIKALAGCIRVY